MRMRFLGLKKVVSVNSEKDVPVDRIRKNIGGYLFVNSDKPTRLDSLQERLINTLKSQGAQIFDGVGSYEDRVEFRLGNICGELGVVRQSDYHLASVMFKKSSLLESDSLEMNDVKKLWVSLCDVAGCSFAYFTQFPEQTTTEYREKLLVDIDTYSSGDLMNHGFWMTYFDSGFLSLGQSVDIQESGAWTLGGDTNPVTGQSIATPRDR